MEIRASTTRIPMENAPTQKTLKKRSLNKFIIENYPLFSILIGFMLVAFSIGPYHNGDTAWEYDAVSGVMKHGLPYANGFYLINQPPLGFYILAIFFKVFGLSFDNGTFLVTLFGLGCVAMVYGIGKKLYNKTTGFFAAALFAFSPWHLILSRTFLIDVQCLFFSLLSLFVGIIAIRKDSFKLFFVSGIIFAAAFSTKLYAIFILVPLLALFIYSRPKSTKRIVIWSTAFLLPVILASYLWYEIITGQGLSAIFLHADLVIRESSNIVPTYSFVGNFLISYGLGWFIVDAAALSVLVCFMQRHLFRKFLIFDVICFAAIVCVAIINILLATGLDLIAPYLNAIKYDYQSLPFFCLLAASLITKSISLLKNNSKKKKLTRTIFFFVGLTGLFLVAASILYNMSYVHLFSTWNYLLFRVDPNINLGYSLFNDTPIVPNGFLMSIQYLGYAFLLSGLLWISRHKISSFIKSRSTSM